jgi:cytoskeletal protein CcmA (bactofilin family)
VARPLSAEFATKPGEMPKSMETPKPAAEAPRTPTVPTPVKREADIRKLIVGREISLSGEITACDRLVVEGSVEANLANCRDIDIAETGLFKGSASIDDAEIRGRFEGTLNVRRRLLIRASGKVIGTVRYGQIEIECGGQISGDIQAQPMTETGEPPLAPSRPTIVSLSEEAKV